MNSPVIRVGIMMRGTVNFTLCGAYMDQQGQIYPPGVYGIQASEDGWAWLSECPVSLPVSLFRLQSCLPQKGTFILHDVTIGIDFHWQQEENQEYGGAIELIREQDQIQVINELPLEEYLVSVISSEMRATAYPEFLKAHAVISRSWLLAQIEKREKVKSAGQQVAQMQEIPDGWIRWYDREDHLNFDVCADDHCQRYQGLLRATEEGVRKAVYDTFGEVMVHGDTLCDTRFSKCCGGVTELFRHTWEEVDHPYLQSVFDGEGDTPQAALSLNHHEGAREWIMSGPDVFCRTSDKDILSQVLNDYDQGTTDFFRWKVSYSADELRSLIKKRTGIEVGDVMDLIPLERGASGRIITLKIVGTGRTLTLGKELEIRKSLSPTHLYSSAFWVEKTGDVPPTRFVLHGAGWGHGVGLCQIGAAVMSARGYSYQQILRHYFRGASVCKQYDNTLGWFDPK